jgi:Flp pilus assembly protein TadG
MVHRISRLPKRRGFLGLLSDTRGSELLEMAFGLPLLLVFMVGIADFGGAYNLKHRLSNAVREGARFATSESDLDAFSNGAICTCTPASVSAIRDVVANYLTNAGVAQCAVSTTATQSSLKWTFDSSTSGSGCGNFSLVIDRNNTATTNGTTTVPATHVSLTYPYTWQFNKVMGLLVNGANPTLPATISSDVIMENLP